MATLFIPTQLRPFTDGQAELTVDGGTLREVFAAAAAQYPRFVEHILREGEIVPGIAIAIDGAMTNRGLLAKVGPASEVHLLPAIGAG